MTPRRPGSASEAAASALDAAAARFAAGDPRAALAALDAAAGFKPTGIDKRRLEILRLRVGVAAGLPPAELLRLPTPAPGADPVAATTVGAAFRRLAPLVHPDKARGLEGAADAFRALVDAAEAAGAAASVAAGRVPLDRTSGLVPTGSEWWAGFASDDSDDGSVDPALAADAAACAALGVDDLTAEVDARADAVFDGAAPGTQAAKAARLATARAALAVRLASLAAAAGAGAEESGGFLR